VFKLVTIGDYGVGKSRLYLRYAVSINGKTIQTKSVSINLMQYDKFSGKRTLI